MTTEPDILLLTRDSSVAVVTLNRPQRHNAFSSALSRAFIDTLAALSNDDSCRAVVVTGAGRSFCSGGDVATFPTSNISNSAAARRDPLPAEAPQQQSMSLAVRRCRKIVVAAIHGYALGAGMGLALACDLRIAAEDARFGVLQLRRGIPPDGGLTYLLPRIVGTQRALELALRGADGDYIPAGEALALGLVARVVPAGTHLEEALALAHRIAAGPTLAYALAKQTLYAGTETPFAGQLTAEHDAITIAFASADAAEAQRAFLEKRDPYFTGR